MAVRVEINEAGFSQVFRAPDGAVGRDLDKRATRVELAAKAQAGVATGSLRRDIKKTRQRGSVNRQTIRVGSNKRYAFWHHQGTRPHVIRPKSAKALRFVSGGQVVFARVVQHPGTAPNHYLSDNLHLAGGRSRAR